MKTILTLLLSTLALTAQPSLTLEYPAGEFAKDAVVIVKLVGNDIKDLDTYTCDVLYNDKALRLQYASHDAAFQGMPNALAAPGRKLIPFVKKKPGKVNFAITVAGAKKSKQKIENGILGVLVFKVVGTEETGLALDNVELLDSERKRIVVGQ
ncbi:MAG: hypothetical protein GF398_09210 [Chitinivibrionales bacterium]|nr:hypothetical protein [Chitinivibrionales bacterium]